MEDLKVGSNVKWQKCQTDISLKDLKSQLTNKRHISKQAQTNFKEVNNKPQQISKK